MYTFRCEDPKHGIQYLTRVEGLRWTQAYPGGFQSCQFAIPGDRTFAPFSDVKVCKGPVVCFEGRLGDRRLTRGPDGAYTQLTAYGDATRLTDDLFGPRVYADTRTASWKLYNPLTAPVPTGDHAPEKFTTRSDTGRFRIAAKPRAIFRALDMETFYFEMPKVAGAYISDGIEEIDFDLSYNFPTGQWALVAWEWDGAQVQVRRIVATTAAGLSAQAVLAGTVSKTAGSAALAGSGTSFTSDLVVGDTIGVTTPAQTLSGTATKTAGSTSLSGSGTAFGVLSVGDQIDVGGEIRRVNTISGPTTLAVDVAWGVSAGGQTVKSLPNVERRHVRTIASDTSLTVDAAFEVTASGQALQKLNYPVFYVPNLANCKVVGFALRSLADQAGGYPGFVDDGAGSSPAHSLEYAGDWYGELNSLANDAHYQNGGGMQTRDNTASVSMAKDGGFFYPDGTTRTGGAGRLKFTGRTLEWYAQKWGSFGNVEWRLFSKTGVALANGTVDLYDGTGRTFNNKVLDLAALGHITTFDTYVLTLRNLGTSTAGGAPSNMANVDYFLTGVKGMAPFRDDDLYAEIANVRVVAKIPGTEVDPGTSIMAPTAATVARGIIAKYSAADIGLSASTIRVNESGAVFPAFDHLTFDDPITGDEALNQVCALGTQDDKPVAWAVWENKQLWLEVWDTTGSRFLYVVSASDAQIDREGTIQEGFALVVAPTYTDTEGRRQIGADVTSTLRNVAYSGRQRRIILPTDAKSAADAAEIARTFLAVHDAPSIKTRVQLRRPLRDQGGALVPLDEVRAGRPLRITGGLGALDEIGSTLGVSGTQAMITRLEYDADAGTLTLDLGDAPDTFERMLARLKRDQARQALKE